METGEPEARIASEFVHQAVNEERGAAQEVDAAEIAAAPAEPDEPAPAITPAVPVDVGPEVPMEPVVVDVVEIPVQVVSLETGFTTFEPEEAPEAAEGVAPEAGAEDAAGFDDTQDEGGQELEGELENDAEGGDAQAEGSEAVAPRKAGLWRRTKVPSRRAFLPV